MTSPKPTQRPRDEVAEAAATVAEAVATEAEAEAEAAATVAVEQDLEELAAQAAERDEYLALAQRTQADFENYRKRMAREVGAAESRGVERLARELLPALDNLSLALKAGVEEGGDSQLAEGVRIVHSELLAALARAGVEAFSPEGERFDPNLHEAMAQQPVEGCEPGTVAEVYQQGYLFNGTVLRPARVVVAA